MGSADLAAVRAEGEAEGKIQGEVESLRDTILYIFAARELEVDDTVRLALDACQDPAVLRRWHREVITARRADDVIA